MKPVWSKSMKQIKDMQLWSNWLKGVKRPLPLGGSTNRWCATRKPTSCIAGLVEEIPVLSARMKHGKKTTRLLGWFNWGSLQMLQQLINVKRSSKVKLATSLVTYLSLFWVRPGFLYRWTHPGVQKIPKTTGKPNVETSVDLQPVKTPAPRDMTTAALCFASASGDTAEAHAFVGKHED